MNRFFILMASGLLLSCGSGQTPSQEENRLKDTAATANIAAPSGPVDTAALVNDIRAVFERVNSMPLSKKEFSWEADTACAMHYMGGKMTYYYNKDTLVKIHDDGAEDHGEWKEDYYFKEGKLIFVFYDNAYGSAANPTAYKYQSRYYFNEDHIIKKIESANYSLDDHSLDDIVKTANKLYQAKDAGTISKILSCD